MDHYINKDNFTMKKYTIGLDFGTLSVRALLVNALTGNEIASSVFVYPHGVMELQLPDGTPLEKDFALQHPRDYVEGLAYTIKDILSSSNVNKKDIIGIGVDFTACTMLPVTNDGTPLCYLDEFVSQPQSYVKLWKHHAAQPQADRMNAIAEKRGEEFIKRYGGKINCEWEMPKLMEVLDKSPEVYNAMRYYVEAADWIVWIFTGKYFRNACCAGYKGLWNKNNGYPSKEYFKALDSKLENVIEDKFDVDILYPGDRAGYLNSYGAALTGLCEGIAIAVPVIDAHAALPAAGIKDKGRMLAIMGTSTCHILLGEDRPIEGVSGIVEDGVIVGEFAYEAGQACVGDHFQWVVEKIVPNEYYKQAKEKEMNIYKYMDEKAAKLRVGESGLLALDWFNGNRSILVDANLTGMILGLRLTSTVEEIYRSLIEATAFGTRIIVENFKNNGVKVNELIISGGIAEKSPFTMQVYADVMNMPLMISDSKQTGALGSAIYASVAAGAKSGGYDDIREAITRMGKLKDKIYNPIKDNVDAYNKLYNEYKILHDYFGKENQVMKRLKNHTT